MEKGEGTSLLLETAGEDDSPIFYSDANDEFVKGLLHGMAGAIPLQMLITKSQKPSIDFKAETFSCTVPEATCRAKKWKGESIYVLIGCSQ